MATKQTQNNPFQHTQIALWGPSGAGKDWLFRSFAKELQFYNTNERYNRDFQYELREIIDDGNPNPSPVNPDLPRNLPATTSMDDVHYYFTRIPMIQDKAHQISALVHNIIIHNDKGQDLVDSLEDPDTFQAQFHTLTHAQNIFLVLGIPSDFNKNTSPSSSTTASQPDSNPNDIQPLETILDDLGRQGRQSVTQGNWRSVDYVNFIKQLLAVLGRTSRKNLAVCMTKSDQLPGLKGDPWSVLWKRYNLDLHREFTVLRQWHNVQVFNTSAAGYIRVGGVPSPNMDRGNIRDMNRWHPVNTTAPFFWIFEQIERANLPLKPTFGTDPRTLYIPYPGPR